MRLDDAGQQAKVFKRLEYLYLSRNKIVNLNNVGTAKEFSTQFRKLELLDLSANLLEEFPIQLKDLPNLKKLRLIRNRIKEIPIEFFEEKCVQDHLEELTINSNPLMFLPDQIGSLKLLKMLGIAYTKVTKLPETIKGLHQLEHINVVGNTLTEPSQVLAERGIAAIIDYWKGNADSGQP